jgi:hypothetical protein
VRPQIASALLLVLALAFGVPSPVQAQRLDGFASLPANTFAPGPTSGQQTAGANGVVTPFVNRQPVQGISSVLAAPNGDYWVMSDNGFGAQDNSADFVLRMYRITPHFETRAGGSGEIDVRRFITLRDPDRKVNFPIVADGTVYPGTAIPVDAQLRQNRWLTGGDFDIESVRVGYDGTLWFGDEFGPFLLHTDATGKVLDAPYPLPGVQSPQNPFLGSATANLPRSKGFEGMAVTRGGKFLYPMLEGSLIPDTNQRRLFIYEFDVKARAYTGRRWSYLMDAATTTNAIGDLTAVDNRRFLVIERDGGEGNAAAFKKIFLVDFDEVDASGFLIKDEVVDLLNIDNPYNLGGFGSPFRFPFTTIESVIPIGDRWLGVLNDNNFPFSAGRAVGQPDPNEFIVIRLRQPLFDEEDGGDDEQPRGRGEGGRRER